MPDIFLYAGEPNPNDIKLCDPTAPCGANIQAADATIAGTSTFSGIGQAVGIVIEVKPVTVVAGGRPGKGKALGKAKAKGQSRFDVEQHLLQEVEIERALIREDEEMLEIVQVLTSWLARN